MDVLDLLGEIGRILLRVFVVIAPLLAWQFVTLLAHPLRRRTGGLADPTIIAGMMVGIAILAVMLPMETLTWNAIETVGGFWDLDLWQFVSFARDVMINGPFVLLATLVEDDSRRDLQAWLALAMTLWLVRVVAVLLSGPPQGGARLAAGEVATFLASAIGTVYLGPLLLWSANRLNFWVLLVMVLLIQDYRYDDPPLLGRLVGAVNGARHRRRAYPSEAMPVPDPD